MGHLIGKFKGPVRNFPISFFKKYPLLIGIQLWKDSQTGFTKIYQTNFEYIAMNSNGYEQLRQDPFAKRMLIDECL